ncbi:MAG: UDP-N-acetylglucosamine--N-acetylmuramyl-(pentapeptide) pyrophosphoryl-undecaprenol N-acetylglucosamine transferase, partial [Chitinophagales bacterium]|nr:UDP-N-acetylglucosamine--N-acetylmuramyl-(pentapeptide) pyrophosphoryl-undecaprenol N-acetylglucosamine transferase [Chitinophagales bacterium]
ALVEKEAAILVKDTEANDNLVPKALELLANEKQQELLSKQIKLFAKPNAAKEIAQVVLNSIAW